MINNEYDLATAALRHCAAAYSREGLTSKRLDKRTIFDLYLIANNVEPTDQRFTLLEDLWKVLREDTRLPSGRLRHKDDEAIEHEVFYQGLERYGWSRAFLFQPI